MEIILKKLESYLSSNGPGAVPSHDVSREEGEFSCPKAFREWEEEDRPQPFHVTYAGFSICGHPYQIECDLPAVGDVQWDFHHACPKLIIEDHTKRQTFLFKQDSSGQIAPEVQRERIYRGQEEQSAPKLEAVYDVIKRFKEHQPDRDPASMTLKQFRGYLSDIASYHDPETMKALRQMRKAEMNRLVGQALSDAPRDDYSSQLALPLNGHYAEVNTSEHEEAGRKSLPEPVTIPPVTAWKARRNLEYLVAVLRTTASYEREFHLDLRQSTILEDRNGEWSLQIETSTDMPLQNGDQLSVHVNDSRDRVGTLTIDLFDGYNAYGRLEWADAESELTLSDNVYARPKKSPMAYLAANTSKLIREMSLVRSTNLSPAFCAATGLTDTRLYTAPAEEAGSDICNELDLSQANAYKVAAHTEDPLVLVQGPPGTGKTAVVEQILRELVRQGKRILITAASNTAVDNVCRRLFDQPVLRFGSNPEAMAEDVAEQCYMGKTDNVRTYAERRKQYEGGGIYAGTPVGLLRDEVVQRDLQKNGYFDAVIFDEAGMARAAEFFLCSNMAKRALLFGDHCQLPPFPFAETVLREVSETRGPFTHELQTLLTRSALEYLSEIRGVPTIMLDKTYRCQNPRLMRFSSTMFYSAQVQPSVQAEYYRLPYEERQKRFPPETLRFYRTSPLPPASRQERVSSQEGRPGIDNALEAQLSVQCLRELLQRYPPEEIAVITPYRNQVRLIRDCIREQADSLLSDGHSGTAEHMAAQVATVDSFQGGESEAVVMSYVRSNDTARLGFVNDPNRVNVALTRCRRELFVIGDLECLKHGDESQLFRKLENTFQRDGAIIDVDESFLSQPEGALIDTTS